MALPSIPNVGSQLDRAVAAYLAGLGINGGAVYPAFSVATKTYPVVKVVSRQSSQDPELTGNEKFRVNIEVRQSAASAAKPVNLESQRVALDLLVGQIMAAMMQTQDGGTLDYVCALITAAGISLSTTGTATQKANNADMAAFSCLYMRYIGATRGEPEEENLAWVEIRTFEITAAPVAGAGPSII